MGFIEDVAAYVRQIAPEYNINVCSPIIAQAILESASGTSELAINANNYFGIKYRAGRCPTCISIYHKVGSEQNPDGSYKSSAMEWCSFKNMEDGVRGYFDFINIPRYSNLKGVSDPREYLEKIKADGYATSLKYVDNLMAVIDKYNLTQYDSNKPQEHQLNIVTCAGSYNMTKSPNRKIEYIVIHYTAGTSSKAGSAQNIAKYFNKESTKASADFIVDDRDCVIYNTDCYNQYCWSVGGKKYSNMTTAIGGRYYGICTNSNSISIEMCSNKKNTSTKNATDTDWYFSSDTLCNALYLIKFLMGYYHIPMDHIIMHHEVNGKICPNPFCVNTNALNDWNNFKKMLQSI